jgi:deoxyribonuclease V
MRWPRTADELIAAQKDLGRAAPELWTPPAEPYSIGGCFVCFPRGATGRGRAGDLGWAAAAVLAGSRALAECTACGRAGAPYAPGLLALREGPMLQSAIAGLPVLPDVMLVNATGRDHPRCAGLALHLGAVLDLPTVGVTHRPLVAGGAWPPNQVGAHSPLRLGEETVGHWVRTRADTRPLAVHAAWRTNPETAVAVALASLGGRRTPAPLRAARTLARRARATASPPPA